MKEVDAKTRRGLVLLFLIDCAARKDPTTRQVELKAWLKDLGIKKCSAATVSQDVGWLKGQNWVRSVTVRGRKRIRVAQRPVLLHWKAARALELAVDAAGVLDDGDEFRVNDWKGLLSSKVNFRDGTLDNRAAEFLEQFRVCRFCQTVEEGVEELDTDLLEEHEFYLSQLRVGKTFKDISARGKHSRFVELFRRPMASTGPVLKEKQGGDEAT